MEKSIPLSKEIARYQYESIKTALAVTEFRTKANAAILNGTRQLQEHKMTYKIKAYRRSVNYYETDKMGITHNSNYFRWFEEARIHFMSQTAYPYKKVEALGIVMPMIASSAEFKHPTYFDDEVIIKSWLSFFNGYKVTLQFEVINAETNMLCTTGETKSAILSAAGKPIQLQREFPEVYKDWMSVLGVIPEV